MGYRRFRRPLPLGERRTAVVACRFEDRGPVMGGGSRIGDRGSGIGDSRLEECDRMRSHLRIRESEDPRIRESEVGSENPRIRGVRSGGRNIEIPLCLPYLLTILTILTYFTYLLYLPDRILHELLFLAALKRKQPRPGSEAGSGPSGLWLAASA